MLKQILKTLFPEKAADIDKLPDDQPAKQEPVQTAQQVDISALVHNKGALETLVKSQQEAATKIAQLEAASAEREKVIAAYEKDKAETQAHIQKQQEESRKAEIKTLVDNAVKEGRIEAKNEEKIKLYTTLLESNYDTGKLVLEQLPKSTATQQQDTTTQEPKKADNGQPAGIQGIMPIGEARQKALAEITSALNPN